VDRQPALALARPRTVASLRGVRARAVVIAALLAAAVGLLYLGARETRVFALQTVEVEGARGPLKSAILEEVDELKGTSLVALDGSTLIRRLEALPTVHAVTSDRAFPHTLRLTIEPERPIAVVNTDAAAWVVSVSGRVISRVPPGKTPNLPRIHYPEGQALQAGDVVGDASTRTVIGAVAVAPKRLLLPLHIGSLEDGELTFKLIGEAGTRPRLELGEPVDVGAKLAVAALVLRKLGPEERAALTYLDVSLPDRPVASTNPQVSD
jgi:cell division protein FtsQ